MHGPDIVRIWCTQGHIVWTFSTQKWSGSCYDLATSNAGSPQKRYTQCPVWAEAHCREASQYPQLVPEAHCRGGILNAWLPCAWGSLQRRHSMPTTSAWGSLQRRHSMPTTSAWGSLQRRHMYLQMRHKWGTCTHPSHNVSQYCLMQAAPSQHTEVLWANNIWWAKRCVTPCVAKIH